MSNAGWQRIQDLYHAALERTVSARAEFLHKACAGDAALLNEVQSLLDQAISAEQFLETGDVGADDTPPVRVGQRIGVYQIQALIGRGGMGEVYRARDTRLGRDVAIKLLPHSLVADTDRRARLEREARVLATLNHPHIGAIYGLEDIPSTSTGQAAGCALVLELVEGNTLAERLAPGPLPVAETLGIARQITEALEAAHEKGIVHRDLKPANISITRDGVVKVLDFGLAKAAGGDGLGPDLSQSPTITVGMTSDGMILGTAAYMSPEQARGKPVDRRADIWAFGCVLYEMLTGRAPFAGETLSDLIVAILERHPDWGALPQTISPSVRRLLERCLEKDSRRRLRDIGDARAELDAREHPGEPTRARLVRAMPWTIAAALALMVVGLGVRLLMRAPLGVAQPVAQFEINLPPGVEVYQGSSQAVAFSPAGTHVAFVGSLNGLVQVYVRDLSRSDAVAVRGSESALSCFFSPGWRLSGIHHRPRCAQGVAARPAGHAPGTLCPEQKRWHVGLRRSRDVHPQQWPVASSIRGRNADAGHNPDGR